MFRTRLIVAALAGTAMLTSAAALAQSSTSQPPGQLYSQSATLAQASQQPSSQSQCGESATHAQYSAVLGVQGSTPWAEERVNVMAELKAASAAAGTGDEAMCQYWLNRARAMN